MGRVILARRSGTGTATFGPEGALDSRRKVLIGYSQYDRAFRCQMAGFRPCGARLGDVIRFLGPAEDASDGFLRHRAMKMPIWYTKGRSSPVIFSAHTVARVFMLPQPSAVIAEQRFSA